ncbi:MAG: DoxX family protein [Candidatus Krumholzibacteriia bacterium]
MRDRMIDASYLLLRLAAGLMYFQAGAMKSLGWFGGMPGSTTGRAELLTQIGIGGWMELLGGLAIMLGLFTRPVAFLLSGEMAVAYWQFHAPNGGWPLQNGGVPAALYCFVFLYMAARGGGAWSVDARLASRKAR